MNHEKSPAHAHLLALFVHDLRNPTATLTANVEYLRETESLDADYREALDDVQLALAALKNGLTRMAWIARWMGDEPAVNPIDGNAGKSVLMIYPEALVEADLPPARGGASIGEVLRVFLENSSRHARDGSADVSVFGRDGGVVVRIDDTGPAIAPELRSVAFTVSGQAALKGRADGRYAQFAGFVAAQAAVEACSGRIDASEQDGGHRIEIWLPSVSR